MKKKFIDSLLKYFNRFIATCIFFMSIAAVIYAVNKVFAVKFKEMLIFHPLIYVTFLGALVLILSFVRGTYTYNKKSLCKKITLR